MISTISPQLTGVLPSLAIMKPTMAKRNYDDVKMSLGEHLEELRHRLFLGLIGPVVIAGVTMAFSNHILSWLIRPLLMAQKNAGLPIGVVNTNTLSTFTLYFQLCIITGLIVGVPWLFYQLWKFIAPGLYPKEKGLVYQLIPTTMLLAATGVAFMYYIVLPFMLYFLLTFSLSIPMPSLEPNFLESQIAAPVETPEGPETPEPPPIKLPIRTQDPTEIEPGHAWVKMPEHELRINTGTEILRAKLEKAAAVHPFPDVAAYMDLVLMMALAFAFAFQTPMVIFVLGRIGIVNHVQLGSIRKFALLASVILAAILTPSGDLTSLAFLAVPLYLLYELGIVLVRCFCKPPSEPDTAADE